MTAWRSFQPFLILALVSRCKGVDPCTDYELMWMADGRRSSNFYSFHTNTSICDASLKDDTWYRFEHDAGNRLIERPVEPWYCGTQAPIWMNGTHPTDTKEVTVKACATYCSTNICGWNGTVRIQLCNESGGEFFVYLLAVPPGCPMAYCVDATSQSSVSGLLRLQDELKSGDQFPAMLGFPIFSGPFVNGSGYNQQIYFSCQVQYDRKPNDINARFRVTFLFDGQRLDDIAVVPPYRPLEHLEPTILSPESGLVAILGERHLRGRLGREISCQAESYWEGNGDAASTPRMSVATRYVQFESDAKSYSFDLMKGSTFNVTFKSTLPFTCHHCADLKNDGQRISCCQYRFFMETHTASSPHCYVRWTGGDTASVTVYFVPRSAQITDSFGLVFQQFFDDEPWGGRSLWRGYTIPPVLMTILPQPITYKVCTSAGDPHLLTFDGVSFNNYLVGAFYLVKAINAYQHLEIQVRHETCNGGLAICNCGVIVREGNSAFKISVCKEGSWGSPVQRSPTVIRLLGQDPPDASAVYIDGTGFQFSVRMPSGLRVEIDLTAPRSSVSVYLPPEYHGRTNSDSMCGNCDGNGNDDSTNIEQFKIPDQLNYFRLQPYCSNIFNVAAAKCGCNGTHSVCSNTDPMLRALTSSNYPISGRFTSRIVCNLLNQRKRRDAMSSSLYDSSDSESDFILDDDVLFPPYTEDPNFCLNVSFTWPTPKGKTEQEVSQYCSNVLQSSPAYADCSSNTNLSTIIDMCTSDIQIADDWIAVSAYTHVFEQDCLNNLAAKVKNTSDSTYTALQLVLEEICPNQCSGRGTCSIGTCSCNTGFIGADCSIDQSQPPLLTGIIRGGVCDVRKRSCDVISVFGSGVAFSSVLKCRFTDQNTGDQRETSGTFITALEYSCPVPETTTHRRRRSVTTRTTVLSTRKVSITIDGVSYSNALDFVIFDSVCMECNSTDTCQQKDNSCLISGECFADKAVKPDGPCLQCVPSVSMNSWTDITDMLREEDQNCKVQDYTGGGIKLDSLSNLLLTLVLAIFVMSRVVYQQ